MPDSMPANDPHLRPDGVDDKTVLAVGKLGEALETINRARGALYEFHQLIGHGDGMLDEVVELLDENHPEMAGLIRKDLIGRNVLDGRWTFQIVEEFDDVYFDFFQHVENNVRNRLMEGRRHVYESEMKEDRRTNGRLRHEARPD